MYYIDRLKEQIEKAAESLRATVTHIDSPEFVEEAKRRYPGDSALPSKLGYLLGTIRVTTQTELAHGAWLAEQAQAELPRLERCAALCEALGIDEDNMPALELMTTDNKRYRSERIDIIERIRESAGEIISDTRERECDDAITALESAGFVAAESDDFEGWERQNSIGVPTPGLGRVTIETKRGGGEFWYEFVLEVNGAETLRGKSGQFGELLKAVGVFSREVRK